MCSGDFASINTHNMTNPTTLQNVTAPTKLSIPGITLVSDWREKTDYFAGCWIMTSPTTWHIAKCHKPNQTEYPWYHPGIRLGRSV